MAILTQLAAEAWVAVYPSWTVPLRAVLATKSPTVPDKASALPRLGFWVVDEATSPKAQVTSGTRGLVHYYVETES